MTKFVKVINNKVIQSIVANQEHINTLKDKDFYDECSESTKENYFYVEDDGTRFNKPGIGYTYDALRNAFIAPKPFKSWTLNETICQWEPPVARPASGRYNWNEETQQWDLDEQYNKSKYSSGYRR